MADQLQIVGSAEESIPCFIRKTYKILEDSRYIDVISWTDDGNAIIIKNPVEFAQTVLPVNFKHNNLNSFIRQLNMYDFHKKKTPDGEHVYYHDLFQRGKKYLLKNIRRKNTENPGLNTEKSRIGYELIKTKQDIATILNENIMLKNINREALATINSLENKVKEVSLHNQDLISQVSQLRKYIEKDDISQRFIPDMRKENSPFPLSSLDMNENKFPFDAFGTKPVESVTRIPNFSGEGANAKNWNFFSGGFEPQPNPLNFAPVSQSDNRREDKKRLDEQKPVKMKNYVDSAYAADLSQQIVRNMDQELQYLKQLTSSGQRPGPGPQAGGINSPDSVLLGKRRVETDPGHMSTYEGFEKIYKPDPMLGLNFFSGSTKTGPTGAI